MQRHCPAYSVFVCSLVSAVGLLTFCLCGGCCCLFCGESFSFDRGDIDSVAPSRENVYLFASSRRLHPRFLGWGSGELPAHPL